MAKYRAWVMDPESGNENTYDFKAAKDLMSRPPARVIRRFMKFVDKKLLPHEDVGYELNVAMKHDGHDVVTGIGSFLLENPPPLPFMIMIAPVPE